MLLASESPDTTLRALLSVRDEWFNCLLISTGVVALGIVFEGPEVVREVRKEIARFLGKPWRENEKCLNWRLLLASFGWLLIVVGVTAEGIFEGLVSNQDAKVQAFENDRVKQANDRAVITFNEAKDAFEQSTAASNKAAAAEEESGQNKLEAGKLRLRAEDEAAKRVAIEKELAWRTLTKKQYKRLSAPLPMQFVGTKLLVADVMGDAEGASYAAEIWNALRKAGWSDIDNPGMKGVGNPRSLFFPWIPPDNLRIIERDKHSAALLLQGIFKEAGMEVPVTSVPVPNVSAELAATINANVPPNTRELTVGTKPKPSR